MVTKKGLLLGSLLMLCSGLDAFTVYAKNAFNPTVYFELVIPDEGKMVTGLDVKQELYRRLSKVDPQLKGLENLQLVLSGHFVTDEEVIDNGTSFFYRNKLQTELYQQYNPTQPAPEQTGFMAYVASLWNRI